MTTIVANRKGMAADKSISDMPTFRTTKLFRVHGSIIGGCGSMEHCLRFVAWRRSPADKPAFEDSAPFAALELTSDGKLLWWGSSLVAVPVEEDFYAVGTGADFALGAMSQGASLKDAVLAASRWDAATGCEVQVMNLKGK